MKGRTTATGAGATTTGFTATTGATPITNCGLGNAETDIIVMMTTKKITIKFIFTTMLNTEHRMKI